GDEEGGIALFQSERIADCGGPFRTDVVGKRTRALAAFTPHDVAETRLALALRPGIHPVTEGAAAAAGCRDRPHLVPGVFQHPREHLEARASEMLGDVVHHDRV